MTILKQIFKIILLFMGFSLFIACGSFDTNETDFTSAHLEGMIYDYQNNPCQGASIFVDNNKRAISDVNGRFSIFNLAKGSYSIAAKKSGFEDVEVEFNFSVRTQMLYVKLINHDQLLVLAENSIDERKLGEAEEYIARAEKIDSGSPLVRFMKAVLAIKRDNPGEAEMLLTGIIADGNTAPAVFLTLADVYEYMLEDNQKAFDALKKYLYYEENPEIKNRMEKLKSHME